MSIYQLRRYHVIADLIRNPEGQWRKGGNTHPMMQRIVIILQIHDAMLSNYWLRNGERLQHGKPVILILTTSTMYPVPSFPLSRESRRWWTTPR